VFVRSDSLGGVLISDLEYPQRVVFTLLNKVSIKMNIPFHHEALSIILNILDVE